MAITPHRGIWRQRWPESSAGLCAAALPHFEGVERCLGRSRVLDAGGHAPGSLVDLGEEGIAFRLEVDEATWRMTSSVEQTAFSQSTRWPSLDDDRENGCIRSVEHAYSQEGGLAVLYGNIALDGCVVKTAGVDESIHVFEGTAKIFESQDTAVKGILADEVKAGDVVIIRYEGPKGGPGMQEMLYPTSYLKSKGLGKACGYHVS